MTMYGAATMEIANVDQLCEETRLTIVHLDELAKHADWLCNKHTDQSQTKEIHDLQSDINKEKKHVENLIQTCQETLYIAWNFRLHIDLANLEYQWGVLNHRLNCLQKHSQGSRFHNSFSLKESIDRFKSACVRQLRSKIKVTDSLSLSLDDRLTSTDVADWLWPLSGRKWIPKLSPTYRACIKKNVHHRCRFRSRSNSSVSSLAESFISASSRLDFSLPKHESSSVCEYFSSPEYDPIRPWQSESNSATLQNKQSLGRITVHTGTHLVTAYTNTEPTTTACEIDMESYRGSVSDPDVCVYSPSSGRKSPLDRDGRRSPGVSCLVDRPRDGRRSPGVKDSAHPPSDLDPPLDIKRRKTQQDYCEDSVSDISVMANTSISTPERMHYFDDSQTGSDSCLSTPQDSPTCMKVRRAQLKKSYRKDALWKAIESNYQYLMGEEIIETCKSTESDLSWDDDETANQNVSFTEFMKQYNELTDWLNQIQLVTQRKSMSLSEKYLNQTYYEEMLQRSPRRKLFNDYARQLMRRYPTMKEEIQTRLQHLNKNWSQIEGAIGHHGPGDATDDNMLKDLEQDLNVLKQWLNTVENELLPLCINGTWSVEDLEQKIYEHQSLQRDIESHSKIVSAVLKLCERLQEDNQACTSDDDRNSLQLVALNLERRWHAIWLQSLEWQCRLEEAVGRHKGLVSLPVPGHSLDLDPCPDWMNFTLHTSPDVTKSDDSQSHDLTNVSDYGDELSDEHNSDVIPFCETEYEKISTEVDTQTDLTGEISTVKLTGNDLTMDSERLDSCLPSSLSSVSLERKMEKVSKRSLIPVKAGSSVQKPTTGIQQTGHMIAKYESRDVGYSSESHSNEEPDGPGSSQVITPQSTTTIENGLPEVSVSVSTIQTQPGVVSEVQIKEQTVVTQQSVVIQTVTSVNEPKTTSIQTTDTQVEGQRSTSLNKSQEYYKMTSIEYEGQSDTSTDDRSPNSPRTHDTQRSILAPRTQVEDTERSILAPRTQVEDTERSILVPRTQGTERSILDKDGQRFGNGADDGSQSLKQVIEGLWQDDDEMMDVTGPTKDSDFEHDLSSKVKTKLDFHLQDFERKLEKPTSSCKYSNQHHVSEITEMVDSLADTEYANLIHQLKGHQGQRSVSEQVEVNSMSDVADQVEMLDHDQTDGPMADNTSPSTSALVSPGQYSNGQSVNRLFRVASLYAQDDDLPSSEKGKYRETQRKRGKRKTKPDNNSNKSPVDFRTRSSSCDASSEYDENDNSSNLSEEESHYSSVIHVAMTTSQSLPMAVTKETTTNNVKLRLRKGKKSKVMRPRSVTELNALAGDLDISPFSISESAIDKLYADTSRQLSPKYKRPRSHKAKTMVRSKSESEKITNGQVTEGNSSDQELDVLLRNASVGGEEDVSSDDTDELLSSALEFSGVEEAWDSYQDPPYPPPMTDDGEEKLEDPNLQWDDDLHVKDSGVFSCQFAAQSSSTPVKVNNQNLPNVSPGGYLGDMSRVEDDSDSDLEDFHYVIKESVKQVYLVDVALKKHRKDFMDTGILLDPQEYTELIATCQTNMRCLHAVDETLEGGQVLPNITEDDLLRVDETIEQWQVLEQLAIERQTQSRQLSVLYAQLLQLDKYCIQLESQLSDQRFEDASQMETEIKKLQEYRLDMNGEQRKLETLAESVMDLSKQYPDIKMNQFKKDGLSLCKKWQELIQRASSRISDLQSLLMAWYSYNESTKELQYLMTQKRDQLHHLKVGQQLMSLSREEATVISTDLMDCFTTLQILKDIDADVDSFGEMMSRLRQLVLSLQDHLQDGTKLDVMSSVGILGNELGALHEETRLLKQKVETNTWNMASSQSQLEASQHIAHDVDMEIGASVTQVGHTLGSRSGSRSGLRSTTTTEGGRIAKDEVDFVNIPQNVSSLYQTDKGNSDTQTDLEEDPVVLEGPQDDPMDMDMDNEDQLNTYSKKSSVGVQVVENKQITRTRTTSSSFLRRVLRLAIPLQMLIVLLFGLSCLLEPDCCDNLNNFSLTFSPQLRYVHGPPPT